MAGKGYAPCLPDILIICQTFFFVDLPPDLLAAAGTFFNTAACDSGGSGGELLTGLDVVAQPEIHRIQVQPSGDPAHHQLPPEGEL